MFVTNATERQAESRRQGRPAAGFTEARSEASFRSPARPGRTSVDPGSACPPTVRELAHRRADCSWMLSLAQASSLGSW